MPASLCVYCGRRPVDAHWLPFCGERCKMADLGRWLGGEYRIPGPPRRPDDDNDDEPDDPVGVDC